MTNRYIASTIAVLTTGLCLLVDDVSLAQFVSGSLQEQAVNELRRAVNEAAPNVKIQAGDSLLALGYGDGVLSSCERELTNWGNESHYRTGLWRVITRAISKDDREKYIRKLFAVSLDPYASDQAEAIKSLAQLHYIVPDEDREHFEQMLNRLSGEPAVNGWWLLANSSNSIAVETLVSLLKSSDAKTRDAAAYALRHLAKRLPVHVKEQLAVEANSGPHPERRVNLLSAAFVAATSHQLASTLRQSLIAEAQSGTVREKMELCAALASAGDERDLTLLEQLLVNPEPGVRAAAANAVLRIDRRQSSSTHLLDWIVLVLFAVGMLIVGWAYSGAEDTEEYLLGGRRMKPWAVGISLFATLMSTLTYLALPGEIIRHGPMILSSVLAYPLVYLVVGRFIIPYIMALRVTSAYEILELRLGLSVRMLGSTLFLLVRFLWMALIVYATSDAVLVPLLHLDKSATPWVCVAMAVTTIAYTSIGGLKAVVFTDVLQTFIMLAGAVVSLALITVAVGGVSQWWPQEWHREWDEPSLLFSPNARVSGGLAMMSLLVWYVCTACSDQMAVQRYLATRDANAARRMFGISLVCDTFVKLLLAALGIALFAYFSSHPELLPDEESVYTSADQLLTQFIVKVLPAGISGLVVAGILSAAMDSLSSGLNSSCSVVVTDWIDRFRPEKLTGSAAVRRARITSWLIGLAVVGMSLLVVYVPGNFLELTFRIVNLFVSPLAVLFFMALFVPWATVLGTWLAAAASTFVAIRIAFWGDFGLSFLWIMPLSLVAGMMVGCATSLFPYGNRRPMLERYE